MNNETAIVTEKISRTKSRIVQDPERIKRNIATMSATVNEDKKTIASHEAKIRDLQAKIAALLNIEKVRIYAQMMPHMADMNYRRTCGRASSSCR